MMNPFLVQTGFRLTPSQVEVLSDIRRDVSASHPMRRLLQGDVGSGKTVVAAAAAIMVLESEHEVAFMAPTELLAEQHYQTLSSWMDKLGVEVLLWTGTRKMEPKTTFPKLTIGTHALIESGYHSDHLGMVIIDEQHKFGVAQREKLVRKGSYPHLLVMTATPIPRTLGLTLYGDLDLSLLRGFPSGRGKLTTHLRCRDVIDKVWGFVRKQLEEGRQAFIVYPRIEKSEAQEVRAVQEEAKVLTKIFEGFQIGVLHGRLDQEKAQAVMASFRKGELHALLATTVIEVGVDVPNASVMVVENAEQFGLAQLHQIRGRIGRGPWDSHCILLCEKESSEAWQRLNKLVETRDGFEIAEEDLQWRGPGEFVGQRQSGLPKWQFVDLTRDKALVEEARDKVKQRLGLLPPSK